ncbi:60S ribosomal protein L27 [Tupaia chinensis]|uniref:60S ribosomal protein L27 n=1 Tax=Tupaia chinensis TaxID=246437 RepID=L9KPF6_TUPCH|nr:60S ribosomal protein L27 [Tupaia chinensis]
MYTLMRTTANLIKTRCTTHCPGGCCQNGQVHETLVLVLVLAGRYSGCKVGIVKNMDDGTSDRPYSHGLVAGIDRYPRKVTAAMGKKKIAKRSKIKSFVKVYNYNHLMPTSPQPSNRCSRQFWVVDAAEFLHGWSSCP